MLSVYEEGHSMDIHGYSKTDFFIGSILGT